MMQPIQFELLALPLEGQEVFFLSSASPHDLFLGRTHTKFATQR